MNFKNVKTNTISIKPLLPALSPSLESFLHFLLYSYTTGSTVQKVFQDVPQQDRGLTTNVYPFAFGLAQQKDPIFPQNASFSLKKVLLKQHLLKKPLLEKQFYLSISNPQNLIKVLSLQMQNSKKKK